MEATVWLTSAVVLIEPPRSDNGKYSGDADHEKEWAKQRINPPHEMAPGKGTDDGIEVFAGLTKEAS